MKRNLPRIFATSLLAALAFLATHVLSAQKPAPGAVKWERREGWPNASHSKLRAGEAPPDVFGRGSAIFADGKLIALGEAGLLGLFKPDPEKIAEVSRWQVPGLTYPCWGAPVLAGRRLYLRCEDKVICLDLAKKP